MCVCSSLMSDGLICDHEGHHHTEIGQTSIPGRWHVGGCDHFVAVEPDVLQGRHGKRYHFRGPLFSVDRHVDVGATCRGKVS